VADGVKERAVEVRMERSDDRAICFLDRHHGKHRTQRRVYVNDVVLAETENALEVFAQLEAPGESSLRAIGVDRLAFTDAHYVLLGTRARNVRRDDVDLMSVAPSLTGKKVQVLADAPE